MPYSSIELRNVLLHTCLTISLLGSSGLFAQDVISAQPGQNVTLHTGYNFSGSVYIRILNGATGRPATANFWSITEFWNKDRGRHTGSVVFDVSGLRDELRAGGVVKETIFLVTANGGVWQKLSNTAVDELCRKFELTCAD